jgi:hypothetical protein
LKNGKLLVIIFDPIVIQYILKLINLYQFSFSQCVGGMWSTREITSSADKEIFARTTIRELVLYVMFLVVLSIGINIKSVILSIIVFY